MVAGPIIEEQAAHLLLLADASMTTPTIVGADHRDVATLREVGTSHIITEGKVRGLQIGLQIEVAGTETNGRMKEEVEAGDRGIHHLVVEAGEIDRSPG